jgi:hypothetical protein
VEAAIGFEPMNGAFADLRSFLRERYGFDDIAVPTEALMVLIERDADDPRPLAALTTRRGGMITLAGSSSSA